MSEKISITLPPEMLDAIKAEVSSGHFSSTSEVLREAMRLWLHNEEERKERLNLIRARVKSALDDPRPSIPAREAFDQLEAKYLAVNEDTPSNE